MAISKDKKTTLVADLTALLSDSKMVVYAKYEGLTVAELEDLRKMAREMGVKIKIVKNRLVKVAFKEIATFKNTDDSGLVGQLLYALGSDEDFDAAKVLTKFAKTHAKMELLGGFNAEGEALSKEEVNTLGSLPTKNELIAQVVDTLLSGINGIVSGLEKHAEESPVKEAETTSTEKAEAEDKEASTEESKDEAPTEEAKTEDEASTEEKATA